MESDFVKITCEYIIFTQEKPIELVTDILDRTPDIRFDKDGNEVTHDTELEDYDLYGKWCLRITMISNKLHINYLLGYFKNNLADKIEQIRILREDYKFECIFRVDIESEYGAYGFDLNEEDLLFISLISTRFLTTTKSVKEIKIRN